MDTVMQYITSDNSKYSPYVMHRISKIKSNTAALSWKYIPGHLNLADDATRPVRGKCKNFFWATLVRRSAISVVIKHSRKTAGD